MSKSAYILAAYRTACCRAGKGAFRATRPDDLAAAVICELVDRSGIDPEDLDDVILGCAFPEGEQGMNVARIAALRAGLPVGVPAQTVNRFCASGLQAVATAAELISSGAAEAIIAGGTESMSMVPMGGRHFSANPALVDCWPECYLSMGLTAERLAEHCRISRKEQDAFALASHRKATAAWENGRFDDEVIPVEVESVCWEEGKLNRAHLSVLRDEGMRSDTSMESLAQLPPVFKVGGTVTAGNASQMSDGACALLVVSEDFARRATCAPLGRFVAYAVRGVAPEAMGLGPLEAVPAVMKRAGLRLADMDLVELNEAFASQALAVINALELEEGKVNVNGGAIALGHPLGCTGARLSTSVLWELGRRRQRYGLVTLCVGGGMGAAAIFEKN